MQRVRLACGDEVTVEAASDETIDILVNGQRRYSLVREDACAVGEAIQEEAASAFEPDRLRLSGRDVVLSGRFHGKRDELRRRLTSAGACVRDYVHAGALVVSGDLPSRPTFKVRKARELGARILNPREVFAELERLGV